VLCLAVGTGTAFGVMAPRRTDVPGLATPADSRYTFPPLSLPPLPSNSFAPTDKVHNSEQLHSVDLRKLLLPAPVGAKPDASYPSGHGWYPTAAYVGHFGTGTGLGPKLADAGVRHIAATAWTGPDGVRTEVYLLAFRSGGSAGAAYQNDVVGTRPAQADDLSADDLSANNGAVLPALTSTQAALLGPAGGSTGAPVRMAILANSEIEAVVIMTAPKSVPLLNFQQVVTLQGELLQG
jgi:hypothetical protein